MQKSTTSVLRQACRRHGVADPFLVGVSSHSQADWRHHGFDANLAFEPQLGVLPGPFEAGLKIYDYTLARERMVARAREFPAIPCVVVSWDNTPRRGEDGIVFINATPEAFGAGLRGAVASVQHEPAERRLVFVNAWNEWAEGNHLEPDQREGRRFLEAVERALRVPELGSQSGNDTPMHVSARESPRMSITVITGPSGAGKSRYLIEAVNGARARGRPVSTFMGKDAVIRSQNANVWSHGRIGCREPGVECPLDHLVSLAECATILRELPEGTLAAFDEARFFGPAIALAWIEASQRGLSLLISTPSREQVAVLGDMAEEKRLTTTCRRCHRALATTMLVRSGRARLDLRLPGV